MSADPVNSSSSMHTASMHTASIHTAHSAAALEVRDLQMQFRVSAGRGEHHVKAVNGLSFAARHGEVTALLGPNGAGKTTTMECAQGLLKPTGGQIRLLGQDPWNAGPNLRARAGVMLQDGGLPQSARPVEFLRHVSSMYRHPADMAGLMDRLGIHAFARTPLRRLSGGQKQRVALAAALAGNPEIVFLDEPSAGLDPQSRTVVFDLITELRQEGTAVVLTTHLLDDAQRLADHVVIVDRGTVRASGTVAELIAGDGNPGTLRIVLTPEQRRRWETAAPRLELPTERGAADGADHCEGVSDSDLHRQASGGGQAVVRVDAETVTISGRFGPDVLTVISQWFAETGELPTSMTLQPRSLEEVFLEIAGREIR